MVSETKSIIKKRMAKAGMYILQVGPFSSPIEPDQGPVSAYFFHIHALQAHSDILCIIKLTHHASNAQKKNQQPLINAENSTKTSKCAME